MGIFFILELKVLGLKQTFKFLKNMYSWEQCILIIIYDSNPPTSPSHFMQNYTL